MMHCNRMLRRFAAMPPLRSRCLLATSVCQHGLLERGVAHSPQHPAAHMGLIQPQSEQHSLMNATTTMDITTLVMDMLTDDAIPDTEMISLARDLKSQIYGLRKIEEATAISTSTSAANTLAAAKLAQDSVARHAEAATAYCELADKTAWGWMMHRVFNIRPSTPAATDTVVLQNTPDS